MDTKSFFSNLFDFILVMSALLFFAYLAASPIIALVWILERFGVIG